MPCKEVAGWKKVTFFCLLSSFFFNSLLSVVTSRTLGVAGEAGLNEPMELITPGCKCELPSAACLLMVGQILLWGCRNPPKNSQLCP